MRTRSLTTEKAIREQHAKALILFDEQVKDDPKPYIIEIGQKLISYGYGMNEDNEKWVVYDIQKNKWGTQFLCVDPVSLQLCTKDHLRDISEVFGIGTYYKQNSIFQDLNELNNIVIEAKRKEAKDQEEANSEKILNNALRTAKIEEGKKIVSIPSGAISVIVAELMQDDSDSMTDYFNSHSTKTIYLAFSNTKKDSFSEMRKACLNCDLEEIRKFATAPEVNNNGETKAEYIDKMQEYYKDGQSPAKDWHPKDENREKYSGGSGYSLGAGSYASGWRIKKESYIDLQRCDDLYISTQENRYFCNTAPEPTEAPNFEPIEVKAGEVQIIDYSEKAIAVIGDTKPIKDQLKAIGGRFNFRLTCGAGWIFSKKQLPEVEKLLSGN